MLLYFLFNFFLYGLIGWGIEEIYCLVMTGHFQEDGFLYGPFKTDVCHCHVSINFNSRDIELTNCTTHRFMCDHSNDG